MLRDDDKKQIQEQLKQMKSPVQLKYFTQKLAGACQYCIETESLLKEISELSELLSLKILNFITDKNEVESYGIDKIPATVIQSDQDSGIRFYGIPTGYEFAAFLQLILILSAGKSDLGAELKERLAKIQDSVHIQVFVTPTCPYCTRAAMTAYQFAIENQNIHTSIIEISEFPHLAQKYGVMGVPKVVINETHAFEGALPEENFLDQLEEALSN